MTGDRILVVDDDRDIRDMIEIVLASEGYAVSTAPDGETALEVVRDERPDLILLDLRMPILDGRGFVQRYRAQPGPHAPIVLLTAAQDAATREADLAVEGYLDKPFQIAELLAAIERLVRGVSPKSC